MIRRWPALLLAVFAFTFFTSATADHGPNVVASTSWAAAFAAAAGAEHITVVAPANLAHPADYDPRPSDLLAVRDADFVLLGGFEGFTERLSAAVGNSGAELIQVELLNTPDNVRREVTNLARRFGTETAAREFVELFDREVAAMHERLLALSAESDYVTVAHRFMAPWGAFAGLDIAATFGPAPLTPVRLQELAALDPEIVLENAHTGGGEPLVRASGARAVILRNFPGPGEGLLEVFRTNAEALAEALSSP